MSDCGLRDMQERARRERERRWAARAELEETVELSLAEATLRRIRLADTTEEALRILREYGQDRYNEGLVDEPESNDGYPI